MIHPDILVRLPDPARQKLLLLDGLSDEQLARADGAQTQLNNLAQRRYPGHEDNRSVPRLAAVVADAEHRREELFRLVNACVQWVRSVPEHALPIEVVSAPAPPSLMAEGESLTPGEVVQKLRAELAAKVVERMEVERAPRPK